MNQSRASRLFAIAFAALLTVGMLASVDFLATSEPSPELIARTGTLVTPHS